MQGWIFEAKTLGGLHPGFPLGRAFTSVYRGEETLLIRGTCVMYRAPLHGLLSDELLETSLPRDSSPDILYLSVLGQDSRPCGGRPFVVECPQLSIPLMFGVVYLSLCRSSL